jgi:hypothetical protein
MATKKKSNLPAKKAKQTTDVTVFEGYEEFEGRGFQNQTNDDIAIPFINILQAMSPEVQPDGVDGAKAGMLINSVTQELYDEVKLVPAITQHVFVAWKPRDQGGGIVATYQPNDDIVKAAKSKSTEFGKYDDGEGNDLVETFYVAGILSVDDQAPGMVMLAFTSTKIKAYKAIMGRIRACQVPVGADGKRMTPPLFAHLLTLRTKSQKNPKGTFYVPEILPALNADGKPDLMAGLLSPEDIRFKMGAECETLVESGRAKADTATQQADRPRSADDAVADENLPF